MSPPQRNDRDAGCAQGFQVTMNGACRHLELRGQLASGDPAAGLEVQKNGEQAVGAHEKSLATIVAL